MGNNEMENNEKTESELNTHAGHRERLRMRFLNEGLEHFDPHNILELLLFYSIPRRDTNEIAHQLLNRFGSLSEVFNAPYYELMEVAGISESSAALLTLVPQLFRAYASDIIVRERPYGREGISQYVMTQLAGCGAEKVMVAYVDNAGYMISCNCVSEGALDASILDARDIISRCIQVRATAIALIHNHPRGAATPSAQDIECTVNIKRALDVIDVRLLDHLIIGVGDCYSMASDEHYSHLF